MKNIWLLFLVIFLPLYAGSSKELQGEIDKILLSAGKNVHIGIEVISLKTGEKLYEKNPHQLFIPASVVKLFTAGAALSELGPDFCFETKLLIEGEVVQGVLKGNLYLQGLGDPTFSLADLDSLIRQLALEQIQEIEGDLLIDNFAFDEFEKGPGWMWDDVNGFTFAPMNALSINHNCLQVWVRPAPSSLPPLVFSYPKTDFVLIENLAKTDEKAHTLTVERPLKGKTNTIQVKGEMGAKKELYSCKIPIEEPHLYAANLLQASLKKGGILCSGSIKIQKAPSCKVVATHRSAPLSAILQTMMKDSDNLYADNLFKKMGQTHFHEQGSWKNGSQAVRYHLEKEAKLAISDLILVDGSGLSRYNLASPHHIVEYLSWIYKESPFAPEFLSSLLLVGTHRPLLRVKTGTMSGVSALAGFVQTKEGEMLAFSILINGFHEKCSKYKAEVEDKICLLLKEL